MHTEIETLHNQAATIYTDWIEFTALKTTENLLSSDNKIDFHNTERGTQYFKELITIQYKGATIANLEHLPRVSFIDNKIVKIKLLNHVNYLYDCEIVVQEICKAFSLNFKNFTRIDYAIDLQEVPGFDNVQAFLGDIMSRKIRMKSKELTTFSDCNEITGVSFGKRVSGLKVTIYNKTKELKKKIDKPYIRDAWQAAGFDMDKDVYRIEFSTKKPRTENLNEDGETIGTYNEIEFLKSETVKEYAKFLVHTNRFYFAAPGERLTNNKGFTIVLRETFTRFKRVYGVVKEQANNLKKVILKSLVFEALFMQKQKKRLQAAAAVELIQTMAERYSLKAWLYKTFERLQIDLNDLTAKDAQTESQLTDLRNWKFSCVRFVQNPIPGI